MKKILFFLLIAVSFNSYSFVCATNTGTEVMGGTQDIYDVPIDSDIYANPNRINEFADIDDFMTCRNEAPGSYIDFLRLTGAQAGPRFADVSLLETGVVLNGNYIKTPFSGADYPVFELRSATERLPIKLYLKVSSVPESAILVRKGELLMTLELHKYAAFTSSPNSYMDHYDFTWRFYAADDVIVGTGTCDINNNQIIEVDFGQVGISGISTSGSDSRYQIQKELTYSCDDTNVTVPIKMYLTSSPTLFSNNAMLVRTGDSYGAGAIMPGLGVEVSHGGQVVSPLNGSWLSQITNGLGTDTITLSLVKKTNLVAGDIVEGPFNASGTIVMSTP
jgi:type 1 fimbria pilin